MIEKEKKRNNLALNYMTRALKQSEGQAGLQAKLLLALSEIYEKNANLELSHAYLKRYV